LARILLEVSELEAEPAGEVQDAWDAEIEGRLRQLRTGSVKGVPLEEVKKKMQARFGS